MIRVGLVDFDTSHVVAFTQRLNHVDAPESEWVQGARVVAGWPGDSRIMPERIPGYVRQLRAYGVEIVDSPAQLLSRIDAVMIESQQGSRHLDRARPFLERGLPTFVDKPFAVDTREADAMIALARRNGAPLMSCSALRYDPAVREALALRDRLGLLLSADVWTTATLHPGNPGLLHYGIHGVEMLFALMGPGCREVQTTFHPDGEVVTAAWKDGRIGVVRGIRRGQGGFGFTAHYEKGRHSADIQGAAYYREMLREVVAMFQTKRPPIPYEETREVIAFITAAERSRTRKRAQLLQ